MPFEQYWMGKGINLDDIWQDYEDGAGYISKVEFAELHLLRLSFRDHPIHLPLFDHEAIYKTVKGTFHDIKAECLSESAYNQAAPIFLYRVDRGSGIYEFLAEAQPLIPYIASFGALLLAYRKKVAEDQDIDEKRWKFIRSEFPAATDEDLQAYLKAWTTWGRRRVLQRFITQGLHRVEISKEPLKKDASPASLTMIDIKTLASGPDEDGD